MGWENNRFAEARRRLHSQGDLFLFRLATFVADEAARLAPVLSGALRDSIRVIEAERRTRTVVIVQAGNESVPYAEEVEFGNPAQGRGAQPFVRPAFLALYQAFDGLAAKVTFYE